MGLSDQKLFKDFGERGNQCHGLKWHWGVEAFCFKKQNQTKQNTPTKNPLLTLRKKQPNIQLKKKKNNKQTIKPIKPQNQPSSELTDFISLG